MAEVDIRITSTFDEKGFEQARAAAKDLIDLLDQTAKAIKDVGDGTAKKLADPFTKMQDSVRAAAKEIDKVNAATDKLGAEASKVGDKVKAATKTMKGGFKDAKGEVDDLEKAMDAYWKTLERVDAQQEKTMRADFGRAMDKRAAAFKNVEDAAMDLMRAEARLGDAMGRIDKIENSTGVNVEDKVRAQRELKEATEAVAAAQKKAAAAQNQMDAANKGAGEVLARMSESAEHAKRAMDLLSDEFGEGAEEAKALEMLIERTGNALKLLGSDARSGATGMKTLESIQEQAARTARDVGEAQVWMATAVDKATTAQREAAAEARRLQAEQRQAAATAERQAREAARAAELAARQQAAAVEKAIDAHQKMNAAMGRGTSDAARAAAMAKLEGASQRLAAAERELAAAEADLARIGAQGSVTPQEKAAAQERFARATREASSAMSEFRNANRAMENSVNSSQREINQLEDSLQQIAKQRDALSKVAQGPETVRVDDMLRGLDGSVTSRINDLKQGMQEIEAAAKGIDAAMKQTEGVYNQAASGAGRLRAEIAQITANERELAAAANQKNSAMREQASAFTLDAQKAQALIRVMQALVQFFEKVAQSAMQLARALGDAFVGALGKAQTGMDKLQSGASRFANMVKQLDATGKAAKTMGSSIEDGMSRADRAMERTAAGWSTMMTGQEMFQFGEQVLGGLARGLEEYTEYEEQTTRAAISGGYYTQQSPEFIDEVVTGIMRGQYGGNPVYGFDRGELASGLYYYSSAIGQELTPQNASQVTSALVPVLELAQWSQTSPETAIKGVLNAVMEFGIDARDLETAGPAIEETAQLFGFLANQSSMEIPDIIEFFKMVGPLAGKMAAGDGLQALRDVMNFSFMASEYGLRGGNPGRGLAQLLSSVLDPTDAMQEAGMALWGKSIEDVFLNEDGGIKGGMAGLFEPFVEMDEATWLKAQADLFTQNASRVLIPLIEQARQDPAKWAEMQKLLASEDPAALLGSVGDITRDTLTGNLQNMINGWDMLETAIVRSVEGPLMTAFKALADAFFEISEVISGNEWIGQLTTAFAGVVGVVATVAGALASVAGAVLVVSAAFSAAGSVVAVFAGLFAAIPTVLALGIPILAALAAGAVALGAAWDSNFLGIREHVEGFRESLADGSFSENIQDEIDAVRDFATRGTMAFRQFVEGILLGIGPTNDLGAALKTVFGDLIGGAMYEGLLNFADVMAKVRETIAGFAQGVGSNLPTFFNGLRSAVQMFFEELLFGIHDVRLNEAVGALGDLFGVELRDDIAIAAEAVRQGIGDIINSVQGFWDMLQQQGSLDAIGEMFTGALDAVRAELSSGDILAEAANFGRGLAEGIATGFGGAIVGALRLGETIGRELQKLPGILNQAGQAISQFVERFTGLRASAEGVGKAIGIALGALAGGKLVASLTPLVGLLTSVATSATIFGARLIAVGAGATSAALGLAMFVARLGIQAALLVTNTALTLGFAAAKLTLAAASAAASAGLTALSVVMGGIGLALGAVTLALPLLIAGLALAATRSEAFRNTIGGLAIALGGKLLSAARTAAEAVSDVVTKISEAAENPEELKVEIDEGPLGEFLEALGRIKENLAEFISQLGNIAGAVGVAFGAAAMAVNPFLAKLDEALEKMDKLLGGDGNLDAADYAEAAMAGASGGVLTGDSPSLNALEEAALNAQSIGKQLENRQSNFIYDELFGLVREQAGQQGFNPDEVGMALNDIADRFWPNGYSGDGLINAWDFQAFEAELEGQFQGLDLQMPVEIAPEVESYKTVDAILEGLGKDVEEPLSERLTSAIDDMLASGAEYAKTAIPELEQQVGQLLGISPDDLDIESWTADDWEKLWGIPGAEAALARWTEIQKAREEVMAEVPKKPTIDDLYREKGLNPDWIINRDGYFDVAGHAAAAAAMGADAGEAIGEEFAEAFKEAFDTALAAVLGGEIPLGDLLPSLGGPDGLDSLNVYEALAGFEEQIQGAFIEGAADASIQNPLEVLADVAGMGGDGQGVFGDVLGENFKEILRNDPGMQRAVNDLGLDLQALIEQVPTFIHDSKFVPLAQAALLDQFSQLPDGVYEKLDYLGAQFNNGIGLPFADLVHYSIAKGMEGERGSIVDFMMKEWGLTLEEANAALQSAGLGEGFDLPEQYWQGLRDAYASSMGQLPALTAETMGMVQSHMLDESTKTIALTEQEWAQLPPYLKATLDQMGYNIVVGSQGWSDSIQTAMSGNFLPALQEGMQVAFDGVDADGMVQAHLVDPISGLDIPLPAINPTAFLASIESAKQQALTALGETIKDPAQGYLPEDGVGDRLNADEYRQLAREATGEYDAMAATIKDALKSATSDGITEGVNEALSGEGVTVGDNWTWIGQQVGTKIVEGVKTTVDSGLADLGLDPLGSATIGDDGTYTSRDWLLGRSPYGDAPNPNAPSSAPSSTPSTAKPGSHAAQQSAPAQQGTADAQAYASAFQTALAAALPAAIASAFSGAGGGMPIPGSTGTTPGTGIGGSLVGMLASQIALADFTPVSAAIQTKLSSTLMAGATAAPEGGTGPTMGAGIGSGLVNMLVGQVQQADFAPVTAAIQAKLNAALTAGMGAGAAPTGGMGVLPANGVAGLPAAGGAGMGASIVNMLVSQIQQADFTQVTTEIQTKLNAAMTAAMGGALGGGEASAPQPGVMRGPDAAGGGTGLGQQIVNSLVTGIQNANWAQVGTEIQKQLTSAVNQADAASSNQGSGMGGYAQMGAKIAFEITNAIKTSMTNQAATLQSLGLTIVQQISAGIGPAAGTMQAALGALIAVVVAFGVTAAAPATQVGTAFVQQAAAGVGPATGTMQSAVGAMVSVTVSSGVQNAAEAKAVGQAFVEQSAAGIGPATGTFTKAVEAMVRAGISAGVGVAQAEAGQIGEAISTGAAAGVITDALNAKVAEMVNNGIAAGMAAAEAQSPSRRAMRELGAPISQGAAIGVEQDAHLFSAATADMMHGGMAAGADALNSSIPDVQSSIQSVAQSTIDSLRASFGLVEQASGEEGEATGEAAAEGVEGGLSQGASDVQSKIQEIAQQTLDAIAKSFGLAEDEAADSGEATGEATTEGLGTGMAEGLPDVQSEIQRIAGEVLDSIAAAFGLTSEATEETGEATGQSLTSGMADGITEGSGEVTDAASALGTQAGEAASSSLLSSLDFSAGGIGQQAIDSVLGELGFSTGDEGGGGSLGGRAGKIHEKARALHQKFMDKWFGGVQGGNASPGIGEQAMALAAQGKLKPKWMTDLENAAAANEEAATSSRDAADATKETAETTKEWTGTTYAADGSPMDRENNSLQSQDGEEPEYTNTNDDGSQDLVTEVSEAMRTAVETADWESAIGVPINDLEADLLTQARDQSDDYLLNLVSELTHGADLSEDEETGEIVDQLGNRLAEDFSIVANEAAEGAAEGTSSALGDLSNLGESIRSQVEEAMGGMNSSMDSMSGDVADAVGEAVSQMTVETLNANTLNVGEGGATGIEDAVSSGAAEGVSTGMESSSSGEDYEPRSDSGNYSDDYEPRDRPSDEYDDGYDDGYDNGRSATYEDDYEPRDRPSEESAEATEAAAEESAEASESLTNATNELGMTAQQIADFFGDDFMGDYRSAFGPPDVVSLIDGYLQGTLGTTSTDTTVTDQATDTRTDSTESSDATDSSTSGSSGTATDDCNCDDKTSSGTTSGDAAYGTEQGGTVGSGLATGIATGMASGAEQVATSARSIVDQAMAAAKEAAGIATDAMGGEGDIGSSLSTAMEIGAPLAEGVADGITTQTTSVGSAMSQAIHGALDQAKSLLGIGGDDKNKQGESGSSPVTATEVGAPLATGIADGITGTHEAITNAVRGVVQGGIQAGNEVSQQSGGEVVAPMTEEVEGEIDEMATTVEGSLADMAAGIREQVANSIRELEALGDQAATIANRIADAFGAVGGAAEEASDEVSKSVEDTGDVAKDVSKDGGTATEDESGGDSTTTTPKASDVAGDTYGSTSSGYGTDPASQARDARRAARKTIQKEKENIREMEKTLDKAAKVATRQMRRNDEEVQEFARNINRRFDLLEGGMIRDNRTGELFGTTDNKKQNKKILGALGLENEITQKDLNEVRAGDGNDFGGYADSLSQLIAEQALMTVEELKQSINPKLEKGVTGIQEAKERIEDVRKDLADQLKDIQKTANDTLSAVNKVDTGNPDRGNKPRNPDRGNNGGDGGGGGGGGKPDSGPGSCGKKKCWSTTKQRCVKCDKGPGRSGEISSEQAAFGAFEALGSSAMPQPTLTAIDETALTRDRGDAVAVAADGSGDIHVHIEGPVTIAKEVDLDNLLKRVDNLLGKKLRVEERMNGNDENRKR